MAKRNGFYYGAKRWLTPLFRAWFRLELEGYIPKKKPLLITINHICAVDPLLFEAAISKKQFYLRPQYVASKERVGNHWFKGAMTKQLNCIYIEEDEMVGIRKTLKKLKEGMMVVIFPTGSPYLDDKTGIKYIKNGASWLALNSKSYILPIGISGAHKLYQKGWIPFYKKIKVKIGGLIDYAIKCDYKNNKKEKIKKLNNIIQRSIENLIED